MLPSTKRYTFNTESDVKEGDLISVNGYKTNLQVTNVYNRLFTNYDSLGRLFDDKVELDKKLIDIWDYNKIKKIEFTKIQ